MDIMQGIIVGSEPDEGLVPTIGEGLSVNLLPAHAKWVVPPRLFQYPSYPLETRQGRGGCGDWDFRWGGILKNCVKG